MNEDMMVMREMVLEMVEYPHHCQCFGGVVKNCFQLVELWKTVVRFFLFGDETWSQKKCDIFDF